MLPGATWGESGLGDNQNHSQVTSTVSPSEKEAPCCSRALPCNYLPKEIQEDEPGGSRCPGLFWKRRETFPAWTPVHTFPILGNPPSEAVNVPIWRQQEAGSCWCSPSELVQVHSTLTSFPKAGVLPGLPRTLLSSTVGGGGGEGYPLCHSMGAGPAGCYPKRSPSQRMG